MESDDQNKQVVVNYKLRDSFNFKIGGSLTIRNVFFEGIDSAISL